MQDSQGIQPTCDFFCICDCSSSRLSCSSSFTAAVDSCCSPLCIVTSMTPMSSSTTSSCTFCLLLGLPEVAASGIS